MAKRYRGLLTLSARHVSAISWGEMTSFRKHRPGRMKERKDKKIVRGKRFFSSPQRPDLLWGPPSLLSNGYRGLLLGGKEAGT
jgi:hypothetical protein